MEPIIIIHGGIGYIPETVIPEKMKGIKVAVRAANKILQDGGKALDAVETAIRIMEDDVNFNAGYGSVLNFDGEVEMCASIMDGRNLNAGAVTLVKDVANPIVLARKVLENTPHSFLGAAGTSRFAREQNMPIVDPKTLICENSLEAFEEFKRNGYLKRLEQFGGTVGAVALDKNGHVAAGTSSGGMDGRMIGRIGDTPVIGSGTYADDLVGAVSVTGHGESILRYCVSHTIIKEMESGLNAAEATKKSIDGMTERLKNIAGAISVSKTGDVGIYFTSKRLGWAYQLGSEIHFGIHQGQHEVEKA